jgi:hypothetical protein
LPTFLKVIAVLEGRLNLVGKFEIKLDSASHSFQQPASIISPLYTILRI